MKDRGATNDWHRFSASRLQLSQLRTYCTQNTY